MCQRCVETFDACFPGTTHEERQKIVWSETCFPFGNCDQVRCNIREARVRRTIRTGYCCMNGWHYQPKEDNMRQEVDW